MMLLLAVSLAAADPDPCTLAARFEKQLAAARAPLPAAAGRGFTDEQGERMLRALVTIEPAAIDELVALKTKGRERLAAFFATLQKDSGLAFSVEHGPLQSVDYEVPQAEGLKKVFTPERAAAARRRLDAKQLAGWESLFAKGEETVRDDLSALLSEYEVSSGRWQPNVAWFGGGISDPAGRCAPGKSAGSILLDAISSTGGGEWGKLLDGADLAGWARVAAAVKLMRSVTVKTGCLRGKAEPKVRYDAAARTVEYDLVSREGCFDGLKRKLEVNMPDHGAMPTRKAGDVPPEADFKPLRDKLLGR